MDFIIKPFVNNKNLLSIKNILNRNSFILSDDAILALMNDTIRERAYAYLSDRLAYIYDIGILPDNYPHDSIKINKEEGVIEYELKRLFLLSEAKQRIIENTPYGIPKNVVKELTELLLVENIILDEEQTRIERNKARDDVPLTSGKIKKNEIIED